MRSKKPSRNFLPAITALGLISGSQSEAAILTNITSAGVATGSVDMSALGTTNWAVWDVRTNGASASIGPTATKNGGLGTITGLSATGNGVSQVRGTNSLGTNYPTNVFTWTTGDATGSVAPPADGVVTGVFQTPLNFVGTGVTFSIQNLAPLAAGQYYRITVLATGYQAVNTLTASVGGLLVSQDGNSFGNVKPTDAFQFHYEPTSISDQIDFNYTIKTDTNTEQSLSQAVLQGVAITIVPEPSSALMTLVSGVAFLGFRRREA